MIKTLLLSLFLLLINTKIYADELENIVQENVSLVVSLVEQNRDMDVEDLQPKIDEVLENLISFETVSLGVMGKYKTDATKEQRAAFMHNFRISVGMLFIDAFRALSPENINIVEVKIKEDRGRAKVQFTASNNAMVELLFSMRKKDDRWLVVNFLVDGVNIGLAYRNVFDAQMKKYGDLDMLISRWNIDIKSG